jgi:hypothetical protein
MLRHDSPRGGEVTPLIHETADKHGPLHSPFVLFLLPNIDNRHDGVNRSLWPTPHRDATQFPGQQAARFSSQQQPMEVRGGHEPLSTSAHRRQRRAQYCCAVMPNHNRADRRSPRSEIAGQYQDSAGHHGADYRHRQTPPQQHRGDPAPLGFAATGDRDCPGR